MHHNLKIKTCYFEAVVAGDKRFEIRDNNDRGFQKGDTIKLRELGPSTKVGVERGYTGREFDGVITYVTNYGQKDGMVVFGFEPVEAHQ